MKVFLDEFFFAIWMKVYLTDSDSQLLCEVDNTNQRSSRRLVLFGDRSPTQESLAEVPTAHDSLETTPQDCEPGSRVEDPHHTQMEDVEDTDSVASVATVVAEGIPNDLAEEND